MKLKWTPANSLRLSRLLTLIVLLFAVAGLFCIPIITEWYDAVSDLPPIHVPLNISLYISDFLAIIAVWELLRMLGNIAREQTFVNANVTCLRIISWCCFGVAAVWVPVIGLRLLTCFITLVFSFAGLVLRVMKNLFAAAVDLREENDYTI